MKIDPTLAARLSALSLGVLVTTVALSGCGSPMRSVCNAICDCTGCTDSEYRDCIDDGEDSAKDAEVAGCADPFDDYLACIEDQVSCHDGSADIDGCESEAESLAQCGGSGFGDPCARAIAHAEMCNVGLVSAGGDSCSDASTKCSADCIANAPCSALTGEDEAARDAYVTCRSLCFSWIEPGD